MASGSFSQNGLRMEAGARMGRFQYQAPQRCVSRTPSPVLQMSWDMTQAKPLGDDAPRRFSAPSFLSTLPPLNMPQDVTPPVAVTPVFSQEQEVLTPRGAVTTPWREYAAEPAKEAPSRGRGERRQATWPGRERAISRTPSPASPNRGQPSEKTQQPEIVKLNLTNLVTPPHREQEDTPRGAAPQMCYECGSEHTSASTGTGRLWADMDDEEKQEEKVGLSEAEAPSRGSIGHPYTCSDACKYAMKKRGCKDGANCDHCHLCEWNRYVVRGRVRASNRGGKASADALDATAEAPQA